MLIISNLTVRVNNNIILKNFSLTVKAGEVHAIMGPNGVGKSTLTKVIMGDENYIVESGTIIYKKINILELTTDKRANLGLFLVMQNPFEIDGVTNSEFLRTALSSKEGKNSNLFSFIKKIDKACQELDMPNKMVHRSINKGFSGGEKKKNEVLQMKILEPSFLLLDEVDSGLDVDSLKLVAKNIVDYKNSKENISILMITHYKNILQYIKPDYVHILNNGNIIETGDYKLAEKIEKSGYMFNKENDDE